MDELYSAVATTAAIYRGSKGVVGSKPKKPASGAAVSPAAAASAPAGAPGGSDLASWILNPEQQRAQSFGIADPAAAYYRQPGAVGGAAAPLRLDLSLIHI